MAADLIGPIAAARNSVGALMRIRRIAPAADMAPAQFNVALVGTAWCVADNRYFVTAFHVLNGGQPRDPNDRFFLFAVPDNGPIAYHAAVAGFPFEDPTADMAIVEIAPARHPQFSLTAAPITFAPQADGTRVITYGFPAPLITQAKVDSSGGWLGGGVFLKAHANEGIVAGQYEQDGVRIYELNVGWHHGESGGPILSVGPLAAFALMQFYRDVQTPHGVAAGPHVGRSLASIEPALRKLGARII